MNRQLCFALAALVVCLGAAGPAVADPIEVQVGYSDGLRGSGFFPSPWAGDPGVVFVGTGTPYDAGAIRIINNTGAAVTVNDVSVHLHPATQPGNIFDLWGSNVLPNGGSLILTQTAFYNFDTSDYPISSVGVPVSGGPDSPRLDITINTVTTSYFDTAHVLDTEGFDFAALGNESFRWRPVGGAAGPGGGAAPEPSTLALVVAGALSLAGARWRRKKTGMLIAE